MYAEVLGLAEISRILFQSVCLHHAQFLTSACITFEYKKIEEIFKLKLQKCIHQETLSQACKG